MLVFHSVKLAAEEVRKIEAFHLQLPSCTSVIRSRLRSNKLRGLHVGYPCVCIWSSPKCRFYFVLELFVVSSCVWIYCRAEVISQLS